MSIAVVLHLTDLHFGWDGRNESEQADRKNCLDSLLGCLVHLGKVEPAWRPTVIAISGDIGWSGSASDYEEAATWLRRLTDQLRLTPDRIVVCPGNHDIDRYQAGGIPRPGDDSDMADKALQVPIFEYYLKGFQAFTEFCRNLGVKSYSFAGGSSYLVGQTELAGLSFVALNSSWFCRERDRGQLWVGRPHLARLEADGQLRRVHHLDTEPATETTANHADKPVIALVHHPFDWWHEQEQNSYGSRPNVQDLLAHRCHVILNGHTHAEVRKADRIAESAWYLKGGAAYSGASHFNSFRLVQIESSGLRYRSYEFDPGAVERPWREKHSSEFLPFQSTPPKSAEGVSPVTSVDVASASIRNYLKHLVEQTRYLELLGMGRGFQVELPIVEAFVPLRTMRYNPWDRVARGRRGTEEPTDAREIEQVPERESEREIERETDIDLTDVFHECGKLDYRGVVLLGEPGSGKTTGARQLAWRLASGQTRPENMGLPAGMRPVLLRFRNLNPALIAGQPNGVAGLRAFLNQETHCPGAPDGEQHAGPDLWNDTARHGLLWILDGLDEVVDAGLRAVVASWIRDALPARGGDWFFVTSRFQGYLGSDAMLGAKFVEFHVRGLTQPQIDVFVPRWFGVAHRKMQGPGDKATKLAQSDSGELLGLLARPEYQTSSMRQMVTNPLLLTILCIVFHEEHNLPTGRAELYQHCVKVLLAHWRRELYDRAVNATGPRPYDAEAAQAVLSRLAWWLHQKEKRTTAPIDELRKEAETVLRQVSATSGLGLDGGHFIDRMRNESGILAMGGDGRGKCGFLHLSFQEFLAADYAAREGLARELAPRISQSWWREVALLSLRRSKAFCQEFFAEMLATGIAESNPDLADRCLTESLYFTPAPFMSVLEHPESTPARVAAVLRLLRERAKQVPQLVEPCRRLAQSSDEQIRSLAGEVLARLGSPVPVREAPVAGQTRVDEQSGLTFVWIPAGEFSMGANDLREEERPVHRVRITRGFWLGKYPVTNAQYERYLKAAGGRVAESKHWGDRRFNQPEQPVVGVNWDEAAAYCRWAGGQLPTEAQWEYACRAGTTTKYCFGDDESQLGDYAWYDKNSGGQTQPVGAKQPNAWGLHDMHGNVWEWCEDVWDSSAYKARRDGVADPVVSPATLEERNPVRVLRGGSWYVRAGGCRSAIRYRFRADGRNWYRGFRVCLVSGPVAVPESNIQQ